MMMIQRSDGLQFLNATVLAHSFGEIGRSFYFSVKIEICIIRYYGFTLELLELREFPRTNHIEIYLVDLLLNSRNSFSQLTE